MSFNADDYHPFFYNLSESKKLTLGEKHGTWNARDNIPFLESGVGVEGESYTVIVEGHTVLDGISDWYVGDFLIFHDGHWMKLDIKDYTFSPPLYQTDHHISLLIESGKGLFINSNKELAIHTPTLIIPNDNNTILRVNELYRVSDDLKIDKITIKDSSGIAYIKSSLEVTDGKLHIGRYRDREGWNRLDGHEYPAFIAILQNTLPANQRLPGSGDYACVFLPYNTKEEYQALGAYGAYIMVGISASNAGKVFIKWEDHGDAYGDANKYRQLMSHVETGMPQDLQTGSKNTLVSAINEIHARTGNLTTLTTTDRSTLVAAINELDKNIGKPTALTTQNKLSLVVAVNELKQEIGNLSSLKTDAKDSLVSAINELELQLLKHIDINHIEPLYRKEVVTKDGNPAYEISIGYDDTLTIKDGKLSFPYSDCFTYYNGKLVIRFEDNISISSVFEPYKTALYPIFYGFRSENFASADITPDGRFAALLMVGKDNQQPSPNQQVNKALFMIDTEGDNNIVVRTATGNNVWASGYSLFYNTKSTGLLSDLRTNNRGTLVSAINEVNDRVSNLSSFKPDGVTLIATGDVVKVSDDLKINKITIKNASGIPLSKSFQTLVRSNDSSVTELQLGFYGYDDSSNLTGKEFPCFRAIANSYLPANQRLPEDGKYPSVQMCYQVGSIRNKAVLLVNANTGNTYIKWETEGNNFGDANRYKQLMAHTDTGLPKDLQTTSKTTLVSAINEVHARTGTLSTLTTSNKSTLVAATNEVNANVGTLSSLNTSTKSNLVSAINEVNSKVDAIGTPVFTIDQSFFSGCIDRVNTAVSMSYIKGSNTVTIQFTGLYGYKNIIDRSKQLVIDFKIPRKFTPHYSVVGESTIRNYRTLMPVSRNNNNYSYLYVFLDFTGSTGDGQIAIYEQYPGTPWWKSDTNSIYMHNFSFTYNTQEAIF